VAPTDRREAYRQTLAGGGEGMLTLMFGRRVVMKAAVLAPLALTLALAPSFAQNFSAEDLARC
jgi:hypothetical protein